MEFNITNLSNYIKQIHSTYNSSSTNDSTYNSSSTNDFTSDDSNSNKTENNSTSNMTDKNISTSEITLSDQIYVITLADSLKNKHISYDQKDVFGNK